MIANIGGIFLYSEKPKELADWYKKNLGAKIKYTKEYDAYYVSFPYIDKYTKQETYTTLSIMEATPGSIPKNKPFTINLRVYDLEKTVDYLLRKEIQVKGIEVYDEGKFAWIEDLDGNHIELWEDTNLK